MVSALHAEASRRTLAIAFLSLGLLLALSALAQPLRPLPEAALAGRLRIDVFPAAVLDGAPVTLSPGARIRDHNNVIRLPVEVSGERKVAYVRGTLGEVRDIWLLTDAEYTALAKRNADLRALQSGR